MSDVVARWSLEDFDCLHQYARSLDLPAIDGQAGFGMSFWFWAQEHTRTQEIISSSGASCSWRLGVEDGSWAWKTARWFCIWLNRLGIRSGWR